ncbi:low molecular weight phosphatase family protein [Cohaesibacter celericrescens]|nr:hypothetical protein [Cohaesibacter celericrescens]
MLQTNILFVDETNNGRSILAEAYFNNGLMTEARAFSAGFSPTLELDPHVFDVLREEGIAPDDFCPKPIDVFLQAYSPRIDLIVGFKPMINAYKLPMFPHLPPVTHLTIEPAQDRIEQNGRRRAFRACFADVKMAVDRAMATGKLPNNQAA